MTMRLLALISLITLNGCTAHLMTQPTYERISIGTSVEEMQELAGNPYEIKNAGSGVQYYRYIERFEIAPGQVNQNNYILTVSNGLVIDKKVTSDSPRSFEFKTP